MLPECPEGAGGLPPPQVPALLTAAYYSCVPVDFKSFPVVDHLDSKWFSPLYIMSCCCVFKCYYVYILINSFNYAY